MNDDMLSPQPLSIEPLRRDRITAISSAVQRRPIVLVLGMHRSGTSLCSHILSALGVDMADNIAGPGNVSVTPDNPQGHWERWEIVEFHDRILGLFNRDYSGRFHDFALPVAWWANPRVAEIRREIATFLELRMGGHYFGFKDRARYVLCPCGIRSSTSSDWRQRWCCACAIPLKSPALSRRVTASIPSMGNTDGSST